MNDEEWVEVHTPSDLPDAFEEVEEPYIKASIIVPKEFVGAVMELNNDRRGRFDHMEYLSPERVHLTYELPLAEIVLDYYDQLKSRTRGYASFDYDVAGFRPGNLARVDILVGGEPVDALSLIIHRDFAYERGKALVEKLREEIPRQMFDVAIQAAIGARVIARETVKARRKDVLAKCYGGDISRKRKLLEKQKEGKKRMKQVGGVEVPQEAFLAVLNLNEREEAMALEMRACERASALATARAICSSSARSARARRWHVCPNCGGELVAPAPRDLRRTSTSTCRSALTLRLLRLRHRRRPRRRARPLRRRAARASSSSSATLLAPRLETVFLGGGTPTLHRAARRSSGCSLRCRDAREVTVEANPETVDARARGAASRATASTACRSAHRRSTPRLLRRARARARSPTTSGAPFSVFVMPDSTTSRSISSTASRARAPPTSHATSPRPWRSSPSTSPRTSWRRSRARASRTPTEPSWSARPSRWSPTSSSSSRR